jgi:dipeptidyl aminopeptidase/acylaminoacyl peptidase
MAKPRGRSKAARGPKPGMTPEDVYELVACGDPRVSPDGSFCAFTVTTIDRGSSKYLSAIWLVPTDGSQAPRRFTFGDRRDATPRWSPDGTKLAFTSNRDDEKSNQLFVLPVEGGEAVKLTDLKESVDEITWSPDGTRIAFTSRVRDDAYEEEDDRKREPRHITTLKYRLDSVGWTFDRPRHLFVVSSDGSSEPTQLTSGLFSDSAPAWSPDSARIAFVSARHKNWDIDQASDIYLIAVKGERATGGRPKKLTHTDASCSSPSWSPDGEKIAYNCVPDRGSWGTKHTQIAVIDVETREWKMLTTSLDRNCSPFMAAREPLWIGKRILFAIEDHGNNALYTVPAGAGRRPERVLGGNIRLAGYDIANGMGVHIQTTPTALPEVYCGQKRLTHFGKDFAKARTLVKPTRFTAKSEDGSVVEAWIMRPANFVQGRKYPVLLNIHGGPFTQYGNNFFDEFQVYAGAGYVVVYSNPRGSSGYSEEWGAAINGPELGGSGWGTVDYQDLMAVTDTALEKFDFCDPKRVGVMGGSYGGYMTSWIVGHTDRFKAACSERAVNAWTSMHGSSDIGWVFQAQFGTTLMDDPEGWAEFSPISYASDIKTPLLIMHSENDLRCPIEQAEQLFTVLRLLKRDVEFVRFPAESHELTRGGSPAHRVQRFEILLDWFNRKLKRRR